MGMEGQNDTNQTRTSGENNITVQLRLEIHILLFTNNLWKLKESFQQSNKNSIENKNVPAVWFMKIWGS